MTKRIFAVFLTVIALLGLLTVQALAVDEVPERGIDEITISEDGLVTLSSGHMAGEEISSLSFQLRVLPLEEADVSFTFSKALSDRLTFFSYRDNLLNVYIAGTEPLMGAGETALELGTLNVVDLGGNLTAATVNMEEDSLVYVYGASVVRQTTPAVTDFLVNQVTADELQALITEAESYAEEDYTPESYAALKTALEDAKAVLANESASPTDFNNAFDALYAAIRNLEEAVPEEDPLASLAAELQKAKEAAEAFRDSLDRDAYTKESYQELLDAIAAAEAALTETPPNEQNMKDALAALQAAMEGMDLEEPEDPDNPDDSPSEQNIELLKNACARGQTFQEQNYTEDSFRELVEALKQAEEALKQIEEGTATKQIAMDAYNRLIAAIDGLVPVEPTPTPEPTAPSVPGTDPTASPGPTAEPDTDPTASPEATFEPTATPEPGADPTVSPEATAEPTATPEPGTDSTVSPAATAEPSAPKTGDETVLLPWTLMLCFSGVLLIALVKRAGKHRQ